MSCLYTEAPAISHPPCASSVVVATRTAGDYYEKNRPSTFEQEMQNATFRKKFEKEYSDFLLSELIVTMMEEEEKSVRKLAKEVELSPTVIQKLRSGIQNDIKLSNFISISQACGYRLLLEKEGKFIPLQM